MESITACMIFFIPLIRNSVHKRCVRHSLMPCCINYRAMRYIRKNLLCGLDSHNIRRIVQRTKILHFTEGIKNFRRYNNRFGKFITAMKYTVSNCFYNRHIDTFYNTDTEHILLIPVIYLVLCR